MYEDNDGDGIPNKDDPYPDEPFDDRFMIVGDYNYGPTVDFVDKRYSLSEKCYRRNYQQLLTPDNTVYYNLKIIYSLAGEIAEKTDFGTMLLSIMYDIDSPSIGKMENANRLLEYYLAINENEYILSDEEVTSAISSHIANVGHYCFNMKSLIDTIESSVKPGSSAILSTTSNSELRATCYQDGKSEENTIDSIYDPYLDSIIPEGSTIYDYITGGCSITSFDHGNTAYESDSAVDWGHAIGESFGAIVCEVKCIPPFEFPNSTTNFDNKPTYQMTYKYYIIDIYEWAYHYDGELKTLHDFHEYGLAHQYLISGYLERTITWKKGEITSTKIKDNPKIIGSLYNTEILPIANGE